LDNQDREQNEKKKKSEIALMDAQRHLFGLLYLEVVGRHFDPLFRLRYEGQLDLSPILGHIKTKVLLELVG
jgi:hypothetical protein